MWNVSIAKKQGNLKEMCFLVQRERQRESVEAGTAAALTNSSFDENREQN